MLTLKKLNKINNLSRSVVFNRLHLWKQKNANTFERILFLFSISKHSRNERKSTPFK
jgi:hypothetical protein